MSHPNADEVGVRMAAIAIPYGLELGLLLDEIGATKEQGEQAGMILGKAMGSAVDLMLDLMDETLGTKRSR